MAGKPATRDAPVVTPVPAPPLIPFVALHHRDYSLRIGFVFLAGPGLSLPFSIISGGVACVLTVIWIGWKALAIRRYRIER